MKIIDSNITIAVKDFDKSIDFYLSLGFTAKQKWANHYAQLTAPGVTIGLHPSKENKSTNSGSVSIGFTTDNLRQSKTFLGELSIEFNVREEEGGQFIHFHDPDGTQLYFINPKLET